MNAAARLAPSVRTASLRFTTKRPLLATSLPTTKTTSATTTTTSARTFSSSSFGQSSPLDKFLDPSSPTPLMEVTQTSSTRDAVKPPSKKLECGIDEAALRFRTKCYGRLLQAPFVHPNEHKVVLSVDIADLPLESDLEREIFKEIVGPRWQEDKGQVRIASVSFGSRIENKRHLVSMLNKLVLTSQRLASEVQEAAAA